MSKPWITWVVWDTQTDRQAGINNYFTEKQCEDQIAYFKYRQSIGGRTDIDASGYVPRKYVRN